MNVATRPLSVTVLACLFIVVGSLGFVFHLRPALASHTVHNDDLIVEVTELIALIAGLFILRGHNWARWLAVAWIGFHVVISFGEPGKLAIHALMFVLITYFLFRPKARAYFQP